MKEEGRINISTIVGKRCLNIIFVLLNSEMKVVPVHIANFKIDGGAMFGVIPKTLWNRRYPSDEDNLITLSLRSLLIDNGENLILIDNGWGDKQDKKFFSHVRLSGGDGLGGGIVKAGYTPEQVTDVILTHLHADHCGGSVKWNRDRTGYELTFPDANYWVSRTQWEWAADPNPREAGSFLEENLLPIMHSGHLNFVDDEGELFRGVSIKVVNGHTPGQLIPLIEYRGRRIVFTADLMPTVAHIPLIWNMGYDIDQLATIREKRALLTESFENGSILFFEHDVFTECCTLKETPKGIREDRLFSFSEIEDIVSA